MNRNKVDRAAISLQRYVWPGIDSPPDVSAALARRNEILARKSGLVAESRQPRQDRLFGLDELVREVDSMDKQLRQASEELGLTTAYHLLRREGHAILFGGGGVARPGEFDVISIDRHQDFLTVVEVKGAYNLGPNPRTLDPNSGFPVRKNSNIPTLGYRMVGEIAAQQGSNTYFKDILRLDPNVQELLGRDAHLRHALSSGTTAFRYLLIHADATGGARVWEFDIDRDVMRVRKELDSIVRQHEIEREVGR